MPFWERATIAASVIAFSGLVAKLLDLRMRRTHLAPGAETRYRVLRQTVMATVVAVGVLSALLVIPQVRAIAGGILASSAVLGLVIGFASQRTLANFAAGLLIAFTQPLRLGDTVVIDDTEGVVEEIALTFTIIRTDDDTRLVIPNEKLASDTIRNATIVDRTQRAEITLQVPLNTDLRQVVDALQQELVAEREGDVFVSGIDGSAVVTLRALAPDSAAAERLEHELRLRAHARLRAQGLWA